MSEALEAACRSLERLLERGGDADTLAAELDEAGIYDVLLLDEGAFAMGGALARVAARDMKAPPLGDTLVVRWLLADPGRRLEGPTPALAFAGTPPSARLQRRGRDFALDGSLRNVPWTGDTIATVLALEGVPHLVLVSRLAKPVRTWLNLAGEVRATVEFSGSETVSALPLPSHIFLDRPFLVAAYLRAAELLGAMETAFSLTCRYSGERRQFGRPIAQFQAVQHMLARMAVTLGMVRVAVRKAGDMLDIGDGAVAIASAKALASAAAQEVAAIAHQVHGAIGFTEEYPLGHATRRLWAWRDDYGNEEFWSQAVGAAALYWRRDLWEKVVDGDERADRDLRRILAAVEFCP